MPTRCRSGAVSVGINGTPNCDPVRQTLHVMAAADDGPPDGTVQPTCRLHALDPATLADKVSSAVVANGRAYVGTDSSLAIFGLLPPAQ